MKKRMSDHYEWSYPSLISEDEAMRIQAKNGYHPAGYGFFGFQHNEDGSTSWKCWDNCE